MLVIGTGLFVGFTFFRVGHTLQDLQDQMFAVFMLFVVFNNIVTLSMVGAAAIASHRVILTRLPSFQPHFVTQRALYEVRERPSKTYSWKVFMFANIVTELPWSTIGAVLLFATWYYPIGLYRNAQLTNSVVERGALTFLFVSTTRYVCPFGLTPYRSGNTSCLRPHLDI